MAQQSSPVREKQKEAPDITSKIPMVGRQAEIDRLIAFLRARKVRHFVYYWAHGGLGKTRLLEELVAKVQAEGPGYHASGIIDLYHTDTHSNSDVERAIVEGLDPEGKRWFQEYRRERQRYLKLREMGADSQLLERRRARLSELFVSEFNLMADEAHKLVLTFDTVELLQYESSLVEEKAGLDMVDTRLKPWLLTVLPQLRNILVVFAGRPKKPAPGEQSDPQARLENDLATAFGDELSVVELQPLTRGETTEFIHTLPDGDVVLPEKYIAVAHKLTGGRPIFLHLLTDLLRSLAEDPAHIYAMLDNCQELVEVAEDEPRLVVARKNMQETILMSIANSSHEWGQYLRTIALMPKGVDRDILETTGLRTDEADKLLAWLRPLSFVKEYKPPASQRPRTAGTDEPAQLHMYRLFLHDEMYTLLTMPNVMQNRMKDERQAAKILVFTYYTPRILELQEKLTSPLSTEARIPLRERLQKLQVERLYYLLAQDPRNGYEEYRSLSDQANRDRQVGYAMRLLDEFLRFYNNPDRRAQFAAAGIEHERVIRENALLWLERFHWWAQYKRAVEFAEKILDDPAQFFIRQEDKAILGNVGALWARGRAVLNGYEPETVEKAGKTLDEIRKAAEMGVPVGLAHARLATSIGYHLDLGGNLADAGRYYLEALSAFRELDGCWDELAMLLNNLAYLYASQGQMILARPLAREALTLNEEHRQRYSTGLTLSTLATIENTDGNWREAQQHAEEARDVFDELEDAHGMVLALLGAAQAKRKRAKYEIQKRRKPEDARQLLEEARIQLESAIDLADRAELRGDVPLLLSKLGKVYRELGRVVTDLESPTAGSILYRKSEDTFKNALALDELGTLERAGMLVDYAEMLVVWGNVDAAKVVLKQFEEEWTGRHQQPALDGDLNTERVSMQFRRPLGKFERLQGQIELTAGRKEEALAHFARAFTCFDSFSSTAKDKETMVELLYDELRPLPAARKREVIERLRRMCRDSAAPDAMEDFVQSLGLLLGV